MGNQELSRDVVVAISLPEAYLLTKPTWNLEKGDVSPK